MNSTDYRATAILTEHLGYPPLTLIDNVINAVNKILARCIEGLENYLKEREVDLQEKVRAKQNSDNDVVTGGSKKSEAGQDIDLETFSREIETGTAKLESLLDNQIDKNFDKFELYAFRNIFTIPKELIEEGWIKLKHHEDIDFGELTHVDSEKLDEEITTLIHHINLELKLRRILKLQLIKADKIIDTLKSFKQILTTTIFDQFESNDEIADEVKTAFKSLQPISDNLHFILSQVDDLTSQVVLLNNKFLHDELLSDLASIKFAPSFRDKYIHAKSFKLLESVGILDKNNLSTVLKPLNESSASPPPSFSNIKASASDVETIKDFNKQLSQTASMPSTAGSL